MPLGRFQEEVLRLLAEGRSENSYLAGASGFLMAAKSPRRSADLDLFHDQLEAVAQAWERDRGVLAEAGLKVDLRLAQPGFIRALIRNPQGETLIVDWCRDSAWRFMPPVRLASLGYVLHPVDLAVNKVLALVGREEPRDVVDVLYLHEKVLPLGALLWAACGKDPGLNPEMLLGLLGRRGRLQQVDLDRLDLVKPLRVGAVDRAFREALDQAAGWIRQRPGEEAGCLYRRPGSGKFGASGIRVGVAAGMGTPVGMW
jgi:hypothetical protein